VALPFKLVYSPDYYLPLGAHVFPAEKYRLIHKRLLDDRIASDGDFLIPQSAPDSDILLVHTPDYVRKLKTGTLSVIEEMQMEVPYSEELVQAFWLSAGGSTLAAQRAITDRCCVNIGGGFHHAYPDHGEGFCVIHDVAVAIRRLQKDGAIKTAMVVDCDVHHGNGTAAIFTPASQQHQLDPRHSEGQHLRELSPRANLSAGEGESRGNASASAQREPGFASAARCLTAQPRDVFTISLHQFNNYPALKPPSCIDVHFTDGVEDDAYLWWLEKALDHAFAHFTPDLLCYIAGADPYREDQLGGLALSIDGLKQRDSLVLRRAKEKNIPVMITYAGGYARHVDDTVTIHTNTIRAASEVFVAA
jgi:acetoin utilization deacetylase AcuC-like enzyme